MTAAHEEAPAQLETSTHMIEEGGKLIAAGLKLAAQEGVTLGDAIEPANEALKQQDTHAQVKADDPVETKVKELTEAGFMEHIRVARVRQAAITRLVLDSTVILRHTGDQTPLSELGLDYFQGLLQRSRASKSVRR
jgi:hypothetical protein